MAKEALAIKYRPHKWGDLTEQESIQKILTYQIETDTIKNAYLFTGPAGTGKAQPNFCEVKTEYGDIKMGNIKVGDKILGSDGKSQTVLNVYPQGMRDYVKVSFTDGTYTYCDKEHIWSVIVKSHGIRKIKNFTVQEIVDKWGTSPRIHIPTIQPVEYSEKNLPIHPYVLGALLGNGSFGSSAYLYDYYGDVYAICKQLLGNEYTWKEEMDRNCPRYSIHNQDWTPGVKDNENLFNTKLRDLGLWGTKSDTKFIPDIYFYGSVEQRLWLLRGLLDTDGSCMLNSTGTRCKVRYSSISKRLLDGVKYLCRSLGIACRDTNTGENCCDISIISRNINPFYISRKANNYRQPKQHFRKMMCGIEYMGKTECTCIRVSNEDELYITNDFIVTHNTTSARIFANMINNNQGLPIELDAASNNSVDDIRDICEQAQSKSLDSKYKVFIIDECHVLSNQAWQAMLKTLEEPPKLSIFILCTTNPEKIPATILSRVQRYNFQRISLNGIIKRLDYIVHQEMRELSESWVIEKEAISFIARISEGGMRDAITLMDKCISYSKDLTVENVVQALGVANYEQLFKLNDIVFGKDVTKMFKDIDAIYNEGVDLKQFMKTYFEFLLDVMKYRLTKDFEMIKIPNIYADNLDGYGDSEYDICRALMKLVMEINHEIKWQKDIKSYIQANLALFIMEE